MNESEKPLQGSGSENTKPPQRHEERFEQARVVLSLIRPKIEALRKSSRDMAHVPFEIWGELSKLEDEEKMWQKIIDNKGYEESYEPERQTETENQRKPK